MPSKHSHSHPIFFDAKKGRQNFYRKLTLALFVLFLSSVIFTINSIFSARPLQGLNLATAAPRFRSAPNNGARNKTIVPSFGLADQSANSASRPASAPKASPQNYAPKTIAFYVNWDETSFTSLKQNLENIDELIPEWLHLAGPDGSIREDDKLKREKTIEYLKAEKPDLPIMPLINNFDSSTLTWDSAVLSRMLSDPAARLKAIDSILDYIKINRFSGVSLDFEAVPTERQPEFLLFIEEISSRFHADKLMVSVNIPLEDPNFDAKKISELADFVILMAYNENSPFATTAGPITSQGWYDATLGRRAGEIPPEKLVVSIGNYGYDWKGAGTAGTELTFQESVRVAKESEGQIRLDEKSLNPTFDYYDEKDELHRVWYLDAATVFNQMSSGNRFFPHGYALWRLGSEDPSVWEIFQRKNIFDEQVVSNMEELRYGYDIDFEGIGEILRISERPRLGRRELVFDPGAKLIKEETITAFPSAYLVRRWGGSDPKKIALTFDDGPDPKTTGPILDIMKKYKAPATFFVIGLHASRNPGLLKRMIEEGHTIGNHTFTHPNISLLSEQIFKFELNATRNVVEIITGRRSLLFRPPYAEDLEPETPDQMRLLAATDQHGYYTVGMHVDPKDWSPQSADKIVAKTLANIENGSGNVVLLHDGGGNRAATVEALPRVIEELRSRGYKIVSLADLLGVPPEKIMPAVSDRDWLVSQVNSLSYLSIFLADKFFIFFFFLGISLGIFRSLFIQTLAIIQTARNNRRVRRLERSDFFPKVSVIIPAFNEERVIVSTVNSILASDYPDFELVVVDDGSADSTYQKLLENFGDTPKVRIFTKTNSGKSDTLNFALRLTSAEFVVTLDADTVFLPDTIRKLVRNFSDSKVGAVAGNAKVGNRVNAITRWQALEYITSQNNDRRAFDLINSIAVVPGAAGAWRRKVIEEAGWFSTDTLTEDADLTFSVIRNGYRVVYEDEAVAFTEAPETVSSFLKQRFRWMYGMFQTAWKHKDTAFRPRYKALGFIAIPNILLFQVVFPIISPVIDLALFSSLGWSLWQHFHHIDISAAHVFRRLFDFYIIFLAVDFAATSVAFLLESKSKEWRLVFWLPIQRFCYRQLMYYISFKVITKVIKGQAARWGKSERKATVRAQA